MSDAHPLNFQARMRTVLERVVAFESFKQFLTSRSISSGDFVLVNNSFLHRGKLETKKSDLTFAVRMEGEGHRKAPELVKGFPAFNTDYALKRKADPNGTVVSFHDALGEQASALGDVVFSLIGSVAYDETFDVELKSMGERKLLVLDPTAGNLLTVQSDRLVVNSASDPERVVQFADAEFKQLSDDQARALREALRRIDEEAQAPLVIPRAGDRQSRNLLGDICAMLEDERSQYAEAFDACGGEVLSDRRAFNDILRVSYNFVSDAHMVLNLVVSVCDLKPLVLWLTLPEHIDLSDALRDLPWTKGNKPSLAEYEAAVRDARNYAFHSLITFNRGLRVALPDSAIRGAVIHTFARHKKKLNNRLEYPDQQLIELLVRFTRPEQRALGAAFWEKNLKVMDAVIRLFRSTETALWQLRSANVNR